MDFRYLCAVIACSLVLCNGDEECANVDEDGTCLERCLEDMFVYQTGCDNVTMSQKTCRQPIAKSLGHVCDYTRCECTEPKLWDEAAKKCVLATECSDQSKLVEEENTLKKKQDSFTFPPDLEQELN